MPRLDGIEATRRIKRDLPGIRVLVFSVFTEYMEASITAGSDGCVTKDCKPTDPFDQIRRMVSDLGTAS